PPCRVCGRVRKRIRGELRHQERGRPVAPRPAAGRRQGGRVSQPPETGMESEAQRVPGGRSIGPKSDQRSRRVPQTTCSEPPLGPVRLLSTPLEVEKAVEREVEDMAALGRPIVGPARERLREEYKLRYYFGGQPFAYRETDQGKEILAVGFKAMGRL